MDSEWAQALDNAEQDISRLLSSLPKDRVLEYVRDLRFWSNRVYDEQITKAFRILNAQGYSRSQCATALGISAPALRRILTQERSPTIIGRNPRTDLVPDDVIDIRSAFAALKDDPGPSEHWKLVAETAKAHPGRWVYVTDEGHSIWAWQARNGRMAALRPAGAFDAITRKGNGIVGRLYVAYIGDEG